MFKQYLSEDDIKHDGNNVKASILPKVAILNFFFFAEARSEILLDNETFKLKQWPWN